jgi:hypothetical protein
MTFVAAESAHSSTTRVPSIAVLGADALLAALPATSVQLAHACMLAGYQSVVPASWGDELIAAASLRALGRFGGMPAVQCSCPFVAHRLLAAGTDLRPFLVSLVAPPVAVARYLRAAHAPAKLRITFVGRCPGAAEESIDARLTPEELLAMLADRGISLENQPRVFDSVLPPDRRRYRSQPGGLPTSEMLWAPDDGANGGKRTLVELHGEELSLELAQHLLAGKATLLDVAGRLGCLCSGAAPGVDATSARARVTAIEPPRALGPVIDERVVVDLELPLPASPRSAIDVIAPSTGARAGNSENPLPGSALSSSNGDALGSGEDRYDPARDYAPPEAGPAQSIAARRQLPLRSIARPTAVPTARDASGRQLPRTYVARRRSPSRGIRAVSADAPPDVLPTPDDTSSGVAGTEMMAPTAIDMGHDDPSAKASASPEMPTTPRSEQPAEKAPIAEPADAPRGPVGDDAPLRVPMSGFGSAGVPAVTANGGETHEMPLGRTTTTPEESSEGARYRERAVELPVTRRSDASKREAAVATPVPTTDRPLAQLLVFALLIATIVLVSAAVGLVVGRWMAQR